MQPQIPVINTVKALADWVRGELVARNIVPDGEHVVYANGDPGKRTTPGQSKLPMVWFWLEKPFSVDVGQTGDPAPIGFDEVVDEQAVVAPSIGVKRIRARVVMHARVPEEGTATPPRRGRVSAKNAEEASSQLFDRVYASIWRACNGSFRVVGAQNFSPLGSEFAEGSACEMIVELLVHIPDDAYAYDDAEQVTTVIDSDGDGGGSVT